MVGERARDLSRLSVQVLRAARPAARGRAGRRGGDGSAAAGPVRARGVREVLQALAGARAIARSRRTTSPRRARSFADVVDEASSGCRTPKPASSARGCSDRRPPPVSARPCCAWKPSGRSPVVERLLEHRLEGAFTIDTTDGPRAVALRGKADRVDLLEDGTFRLIDYKLGWPPDRRAALQLPIYGLCAEQQLAGRARQTVDARRGGLPGVQGTEARRAAVLGAGDRDECCAEAQQRLVDAIDAHRARRISAAPDDVYRCETCSFAAVCRKDYVGDV